MATRCCWLVVFAFAITLTQVLSEDETYRAAVLEFFPVMISATVPEEIAVKKNTDSYLKFMKEAKAKEAEIILFPEAGLRTTNISSPIPEPHKKISPCDDKTFETTEHVRRLSCGAKENKIYSVVNLLEKRFCDKNTDENCPDKGYYVFNTNAVFDKDGIVIARYPKYNLYNAHLSDKPNEPEIVFFDTSFGVRFGTFSCFDILYQTPTLRLVKQFGITDFVFPTHWFSQIPFLTALQAQRGWAETNNVNLLAASLNYPESASGGSGIYHGKHGPLIQIMPEKPTSVLLVADVPKYKRKKVQDEETNMENVRGMGNTFNTSVTVYENVEEGDENMKLVLNGDKMQLYESAKLRNGLWFDKRLCSRNNFCCSFRGFIQRKSKNHPNLEYRAVVLDSVREFKKTATVAVQCCGIILCNGPSILNCTSRAKELPKIFRIPALSVEGEFPKTNSLQMPNTLTDGKDIIPLPNLGYEFRKEERRGGLKVSLNLLWPSTNLRTFAIYGRDFTRDGDPHTEDERSLAPAPIPSLPLSIASVTLVLYSLKK